MTNEDNTSKTWTEKIELSSREVVERIKELVEEGNVRRIIVKGQNDEFRLEIPMTAGIAVSGVMTVVAPWLVAIGALAALVAKVEIEIVRVNESGTDEAEPPDKQ